MTLNDPKRVLAHKLSLVSGAWRRLADQALAQFRVSNSAGWCLIYIDRLGPEVRQTDLAEHMQITQPSLFRTVTHLETNGLVKRNPHPEDGRSNRIALTIAGRELVGRIEERLDALRRDLLFDVPDAEVEAVIRLLDLLNSRIADRRGQT